jgi:hypothetical protein
MQNIRRFLVLGLFATILLSALPRLTVSACGGFFCSNIPIDQNAERIIFVVDRRVGTTTAVIGINYKGDADQFSWVLPVPDIPKLDVAQTASLTILDVATSVQINPPRDPCQNIFPQAVGFGGGGGGGGYLETGQVGPYDYAIIKNEKPGELIAWLRNNGYRVTKAMEPIIEEYVQDRMYFVAMRLKRDKDVTDIQPIVLTYKSVEPMIPIKLTAIAAVPDMPVLVWVFSDKQFVPKNYANPKVDFSHFQGSSEVASMGQGYSASFFFSALPQYNVELKRIQEQYHGLAFVTEYAKPAKTLLDLVQGDELLSRLIEERSYITQLRAQMSPEQMTLDPYFIASPADNPADVSNVISLDKYVDPVQFWGCSSRTAIDDKLRANIPPDRTHFDDFHLDVAHPTGWVMSQFEMGGRPLYALAPVKVSARTIDAFFNDENTVSMFVFRPFKGWVEEDRDPSSDRDMIALLQHGRAVVPADKHVLLGLFYPSVSQYASLDDVNGIRYGMLIGASDWKRNQSTYEAMMAYVQSHQYFARPDFRHTLFLGAGNLNGNISVEIPFHDGWIDRTDSSGDVVITPDKVRDADQGPAIRLTHDRFLPNLADGEEESVAWEKMRQWAIKFYNLPSTIEWPLIPSCFDSERLKLTAFKSGDRMGYVIVSQQYVAGVYAPAADWARYRAALSIMLQSFTSTYCSSG